MSKEKTIISLLEEINKNIDNVGSGGSNTNLKELTVTANGEYIPADYGVDGFSKVTANVNVQKIKVSGIRCSNECLDENGRWQESFIDTSLVSNFSNCFSAPKLKRLEKIEVTSNATNVASMFSEANLLEWADVSDYDFSNVTNLQRMFYNAYNIDNIDVSRWNVNNVTNIVAMFYNCYKLTKLDLTNWNVGAVTNILQVFYNCINLVSLVGEKTITEVLDNNISCLNGLKISSTTMFNNIIRLNRASLRALINGLADFTGSNTRTLTLNESLIAKLTEEDIAIATAKNWTIA